MIVPGGAAKIMLMAIAGFMAPAWVGTTAPHGKAPAGVWSFPWWLIAVLLAALFLLYAVVVYLRRVILDSSPAAKRGLTMEQADKLSRDGLLSDQEYQRIRRAVLREFYDAGVAAWPWGAEPFIEPGKSNVHSLSRMGNPVARMKDCNKDCWPATWSAV